MGSTLSYRAIKQSKVGDRLGPGISKLQFEAIPFGGTALYPEMRQAGGIGFDLGGRQLTGRQAALGTRCPLNGESPTGFQFACPTNLFLRSEGDAAKT